ncbi:LacI family DNA-binding transcriptional regulator [Pontibacillus sp. HMF3514]|uniref:LacI family DNA-binding transcriptional regulator n=1 Tax=Pontibacillus sp. HMF3514 TaxID=2692425 RepID=UPI00131F5EAD|nr:LacI family DNA-binding transcriptional regulator [Pontibacillus sp. HMF3514]QHE53658.1 substrate-binding domain-containing protein [Pontibacillus sp. HMF3514]
MVTIYQIAEVTGFSATTVSKVLNNYQDVSPKTRKKILETVEELGYLPNSHARSLSTKKSWIIGVVFIESLGVGMKHPFFNAVIESFRKNVEAHGYDLLFASRNISNKQKSYLEYFKYRGVDGVVIACSSDQDEQVQELINSSIPSVVIDLNSDQSCVIYSDNYRGSQEAVQYLHSLGHRKIAHIAGHSSTFAGQQRLNGYVEAMKTLQLSVPEGYITDGEYFSRDSGYKAMKNLLELEDPPTAVFAAADNLAIGAIAAIREAGYDVPEDFSVIGFDDIDVSQMVYPSLTTIRQQTDLIGEKSGQLLIHQINTGQKDVKRVVVPVELMIRNSCKTI